MEEVPNIHIMTARDRKLYRAAYSIGLVGACNARAVRNTLKEYDDYPLDHVAIKVIQGHLDYLDGKSLGPELHDMGEIDIVCKREGLI